MRRVIHIDGVPQYRLAFFEGARARLAEYGVAYEVITGTMGEEHAGRGDEASLAWEHRINNRHFKIGRFNVLWQPALHEIWQCDLAIVGHQNRRLVNYIAQALAPIRPSKLAFWGHGRNFQTSPEGSLTESWKRLWATRCDWWFGYTEETRRIIESYGFPRDHITIFNNAIDTSQMKTWASEISNAELEAAKRKLDISTDNVGIYVGSLYKEKRIAFLLDAANKIRTHIPDFTLIVIGGGTDQHLVEKSAIERPWIKYLGPRYGREKAVFMRLGRTFLMPGAVGLAVLDCSALGIPMITTSYPFHGPEFAYLHDGENSLIVQDSMDLDAYAAAVTSVLLDDQLQTRLASGARKMAEIYTLESMVERFSDGVMACLSTSKRTGRTRALT